MRLPTLLLLLLAPSAFPQVPDPPRPTVRAHGTAAATAKPDQVRIDIGVVTQAQTAQAAGAANARQASDVIAELKKVAGAGSEVRTVNYSVNPNYKFAREGGNPTITGYTATNIVQVTSSDIAAAGKIIDAATKTGANTIHGVQFSLKDEQSLRAQALRDATRQARESAEAMAAALGMKIARVIRIEDAAPVQVHPMREMMAMKAAVADTAPTPVEPGNIRVEATVLLTAEIAQ